MGIDRPVWVYQYNHARDLIQFIESEHIGNFANDDEPPSDEEVAAHVNQTLLAMIALDAGEVAKRAMQP